MSFWNKSGAPKEPALTKQARLLCEKLDALGPEDQKRAAATIRDIVSGIRNLGAMPQPIIEGLWSLMLTIGRKAIMPGSNTDELFKQIEQGVTEQFRGAILEKISTHPTLEVDAIEQPKALKEIPE